MSDCFRRAIRAQEFLVTAEVSPPKGGNPDHMLAMARALQGRVHAVNITDGSRAVARMSSLAAASLLQQQGIEPVCQLACRDRNRIGLQADLMGAHALGLRNVLALTGDPVSAGDNDDAQAVFELESVRLLKLIGQLNSGYDPTDNALPDGGLALFPGAAVDPQLKSWSGLKRRFERKVKAGAQFFQSQMLTDFDRLEQFMTQVAAGSEKPVLAGIFLFKSAKNARFIDRCVPGVTIPEEIVQRLERATDPLDEGITIAAEQVQMARERCHGVHMMAVRKEHLIPQILDQAGVAPVDRAAPAAAPAAASYSGLG